MQIKGKQSLVDLSNSVKFITDKFDKYEKERQEKNKIIKALNEKVSVSTERSKVLEESVDQQEQYSCRNCLLIHGVEENSNEDMDKLVLNIINNDLEIDLMEVAIDLTHRIGDPKKKRKMAPSIIAKFLRYYDRKEVFSKKKHVKGKDMPDKLQDEQARRSSREMWF